MCSSFFCAIIINVIFLLDLCFSHTLLVCGKYFFGILCPDNAMYWNVLCFELPFHFSERHSMELKFDIKRYGKDEKRMLAQSVEQMYEVSTV